MASRESTCNRDARNDIYMYSRSAESGALCKYVCIGWKISYVSIDAKSILCEEFLFINVGEESRARIGEHCASR